MLKNLRKLFKEKSKEEIKAIWDSGNHLDTPDGYKVTDWLKDQGREDLLTQIRDKKK
ncbi:hypothetical protein [Sphingobacterium lactis]|uniref:hypothetical protein n=1 Tax=Sphingobacterium lactis TaxID=797291 RepID=UPI003DA5B43D